jgi:hypothetical protein
MAGPDHQHIRQHRSATGEPDPSRLPAYLGLAQPTVGLPCAVDLLSPPPSLRRTHHLLWRPLVQIGYQDFRVLRPQRALLICARQMRYQVFDRLILDRFPRPRHGEHTTPHRRAESSASRSRALCMLSGEP